MLWVAQLDPASYALWYDTTTLVRGASGAGEAYAVHHALFGESDEVADVVQQLPPAQRDRAALLASMIWHEQRHFTDLILTNYGSYRFRQYSSLYLNQEKLLGRAAKAGKPLHCPVDLYADPVRSMLAGASGSHDDLVVQARDVRRRLQDLDFDRTMMPYRQTTREVGGHVQLEALAYLQQFACIEDTFDPQTAVRAQALLADIQADLPHYTWPAEIGRYLGLRPTKMGEQWTYRSVAIPSVILATLMVRGWGQKVADDPFKKAASAPGRLLAFMEYLDGHDDTFVDVDSHTAWVRSNEICMSLFGRSVMEELEVDLEAERKNVEDMAGRTDVADTIKAALGDRYRLRSLLTEILRSKPTLLIDPMAYAGGLRDLIRPMPVQTFPSGMLETMAPGWTRLIGYSDPGGGADSEWTWAATPEQWPPADTLSLSSADAWREIVSDRAPLAKLMIKGNCHENAFGPELHFPVARLEASGAATISLEGSFEHPRGMIQSARPLYKLAGATTMVCDICHKEVAEPEANMASPWLFRKNVTIAGRMMQMLGGGRAGYLRFVRDWSLWVLCSTCTDDVRKLTP